MKSSQNTLTSSGRKLPTFSNTVCNWSMLSRCRSTLMSPVLPRVRVYWTYISNTEGSERSRLTPSFKNQNNLLSGMIFIYHQLFVSVHTLSYYPALSSYLPKPKVVPLPTWTYLPRRIKGRNSSISPL